jgi:predicted metal-dependent peptidase
MNLLTELLSNSMYLFDELTQKAKDIGQISFSKSSLTDPFIKKILSHISKETGTSIKDVEDNIKKEVDEFDALHKLAPILYHTIVLNIVENEIFKALKNVPVKNAPVFDLVLFTKLLRLIKQEHSSMFPMRNFYNHETISNPRIIIIPSDDESVMKKFKDIDTACATPNGEFVFNKLFMQELLNFAHLKGIKPKGKKYKNNGGDIPPEYAYIEFLIMHEFMHYTYADFHYSKIYKSDPTISNWVGDFRTNYDLVKNEHEQLPIGLYNDLINLDRQKNWKEMYDIIKAEFDKLSKKDQDKVKNKIGEPGGEHQEPGEDEGEDEGGGEGASPQDAEKDETNARKKGEKTGGVEGEKDKKTTKKVSTGGRGAGGDGGTSIDYTKFSPSMSWKSLISKLVKTSTEEETSYQKVHRRNITRIHTAAQTGKSALKPGEVEIENNLLKLCIVVDSSGSMSDKIEQVYANLADLIKHHSSEVKLGFVLVKFSNSFKMFMCIPSQKDHYKEIKSINDKSTVFETGSLKKLFSEHYGSSTNFDSTLTSNLDIFVNDGYNVLIITDTDIISSGNKEEFEKFFKRSGGKVYLIAGDKNDYQNIIKALKIKSNNITHM